MDMDLLKLAQNRRKPLLDEIDALNAFLKVADELLAQHDSEREGDFGEAIQFGPTLTVDTADVQREIVEDFRRRHQMANQHS